VLDKSGSIRDNDPPGGNNWQLILDLVKYIVRALDIGPSKTRIAAVDFGKFAQSRANSTRQTVFTDYVTIFRIT